MVYCQKCGKNVKKNDDFCPYCGKKTKIIIEKEKRTEKEQERGERKEQTKILCSVCKHLTKISDDKFGKLVNENYNFKEHICPKCKDKMTKKKNEELPWYAKLILLIIGFFVLIILWANIIHIHPALDVPILFVSIYYYIKLAIWWFRTPEQRTRAKEKKEQKRIEKRIRRKAEREETKAERKRKKKLEDDEYTKQKGRERAIREVEKKKEKERERKESYKRLTKSLLERMPK